MGSVGRVDVPTMGPDEAVAQAACLAAVEHEGRSGADHLGRRARLEDDDRRLSRPSCCVAVEVARQR
jgi:hypothetical protein